MPAYDSLEDLLAVPPATGFTSGFNTYSPGYRRESNPLEAVRRNWEDSPPSPQVARRSVDDLRARAPLTAEVPLTAEALHLSPPATYRTLLPSTAPLSASTAERLRAPAALGRTGSLVRIVAGDSLIAQQLQATSAPSRAASPPLAFPADGYGGVTMAKVLSPPSFGSSAAGSWALAQGPPVAPGQVGNVKVVVPHPLDGSKLGITVKQLVVATITDPRALDFGWALGDRILGVNGVPVADSRALSAALTGALSAWRATGQALVFEVLRPPGTVAGGGAAGYGHQGLPPPGQEGLCTLGPTTFIPWSQLGLAGRGPPGGPMGPPGAHMGLSGAGGYPQHPGSDHIPAGGHAHHPLHPHAGAGELAHHHSHPHAGSQHHGSGSRQGSARRSFSKRRLIC